jgi:serine protease Do
MTMKQTKQAAPRGLWRWNGALALLMTTALAAGPIHSAMAQNLSHDTTGPALPSLAPLVQKVQPAVVNVSVIEKADTSADDGDDSGASPQDFSGGGTPFDQFMQHFFQQGPGGGGMPNQGPVQPAMALGSGFIIDPSGYVVTNNHVVQDATKVTVILQDGTRHVAKVIGTDKVDDLALLKISAAKPLPFVSFGDSDQSAVGDWVVAVGNPFGLGGSVTAGIVSARSRDLDGSSVDYMQIDAPINKGNSGGPTFNLDGQVVGINTAIYSPNGGSIGIAFDIPSNTAKAVIAQLKATGHVRHGWLGVTVQTVTPEIASSLGLEDSAQGGALVSEVRDGSPAASAGLKPGDVITGLDGKPIQAMRDLPHLVAALQPGDAAKLTVLRDKRPIAVAITIGNLDKAEQVADAGQPGDKGDADSQTQKAPLGLSLSALTPDVRQQLNLPKDVSGVVVSAVAPSSPAEAAGITPGDIIQRIGSLNVRTPQEAVRDLRGADAKNAKPALLLLYHQGQNLFIGLSSQPS